MKWVDQAVRPEFSWPDRLVEIPFEGYKIVLQPLTEQLSCTVSLFDPNDTTFEAGGTILARFLSRLAWAKSGAITELFIMGSSNLEQPGRLGRGNFGRSVWAHVEPWPYLYLPLPATSQADLALALFREAMGIMDDADGFLGIIPGSEKGTNSDISDIIELLIDVRSQLRKRKVFDLADDIRKRLEEIGYALEDTPRGTVWRNKIGE